MGGDSVAKGLRCSRGEGVTRPRFRLRVRGAVVFALVLLSQLS